MNFPKLRIKERIKNLFSKIRNYIVKSKLWKLLLFVGIPVNITMLSWFTPMIDVTKEFGMVTYLHFTLDGDYVLLKEFSGGLPNDYQYSQDVFDSLDAVGSDMKDYIRDNYDGNCQELDTYNFKPGQRIVLSLGDIPCEHIKQGEYAGIASEFRLIYDHRDVVWTFRDSVPPIMIKGEVARKGKMKKYVIVNNPITGERWHRDLNLIEKIESNYTSDWLMDGTGVGYDSVFVDQIWRVYEPKVLPDNHKTDRSEWKEYGDSYQGWIRMKDVEGKWWNLWMTDKFGWIDHTSKRGNTWYEDEDSSLPGWQWIDYTLGGEPNSFGTGGQIYWKDHPDSIIKWEREMKNVRIAP
tara:strand:- start:268 stop:1320 length:1053 start_codon:yes stop_codon:yes gene_type:complete